LTEDPLGLLIFFRAKLRNTSWELHYELCSVVCWR